MLSPGSLNPPRKTAALGEKLRSSPLASLCPSLSENEPPLKGDYLSFRLVLRFSSPEDSIMLKALVYAVLSHSVVFDSLQPHGL